MRGKETAAAAFQAMVGGTVAKCIEGARRLEKKSVFTQVGSALCMKQVWAIGRPLPKPPSLAQIRAMIGSGCRKRDMLGLSGTIYNSNSKVAICQENIEDICRKIMQHGQKGRIVEKQGGEKRQKACHTS
ncbi:MAG: hypothetical protein LBT59_26145 [Clostridiales bacterium]|nr:hypothetical protein [Clostridiales bacterium]